MTVSLYGTALSGGGIKIKRAVTTEHATSVPARELWLWKNPEALAAVQRGMRDVMAGRVRSLGSFAQFADDDVDE